MSCLCEQEGAKKHGEEVHGHQPHRPTFQVNTMAILSLISLTACQESKRYPLPGTSARIKWNYTMPPACSWNSSFLEKDNYVIFLWFREAINIHNIKWTVWNACSSFTMLCNHCHVSRAFSSWETSWSLSNYSPLSYRGDWSIANMAEAGEMLSCCSVCHASMGTWFGSPEP